MKSFLVTGILFLWVLAAPSSAMCFNATLVNEIKSFMVLLRSDKISLRTCHYLYGFHSEIGDMDIFFEICKKGKWERKEYNIECVDPYFKRRDNADTVPCLYLTWLRTKIPLTEEFKILDVRRNRPGHLPNWYITTQIGNSTVEFTHETLRQPGHDPWSLLEVSSIDGASRWEMIEEDFEDYRTQLERMGLDENGKWPDAPLSSPGQ